MDCYHSNGLIALSLLVQHLFQQVELSCSNHHNRHQFYNSEVFDFVLVPSDYLCVNNLSLFLKEFVFGDFFQSLSDIDEFGVKFIDLALFSELKQMGFVMCVKINRD